MMYHLWLSLLRIVAYGNLGLLIEVGFVGIHSFCFLKNRLAYGRVSLWMFLVWGSGGTAMEQLQSWCSYTPYIWWHTALRALLFTFLIYFQEFSWGLVLEKILGKCPWKYTNPTSHEEIHRFSIMGLIRLDYAPYWYGLALLFDIFAPKLRIIINTISRI